MHFSSHALLLAVSGGVVLLTAWLPMFLKRTPFSLPMACIGIGLLLGWMPASPLRGINPLENRELTERLTEFVVIVALMGAGLKIDRSLSWRTWETSWRLLFIAMPLTIAGIGLAGWGILGLAVPSALLLGAALAPTDPVLASDVQVGPPHSGEDGEVRFALTSEAGMNDGAAFPFVYLAIAMMLTLQTGDSYAWRWLGVDVVWRIGAGLAIGWVGGRVMGYLAFQLPKGSRLSETREGLAALGITLLCYGSTELLYGYGFLAVFVSALAMRSAERRHEFHTQLHNFSEQVERLLLLIVLVCFGAAMAEGSIFRNLSWPVVAVTAITLFAVRPIAAGISLIGAPATSLEKAAIGFFGIRGLGSFYYLAFALGVAPFTSPEVLWVTVSFVVLASIVIHGTLVTPIMYRVDRLQS